MRRAVREAHERRAAPCARLRRPFRPSRIIGSSTFSTARQVRQQVAPRLLPHEPDDPAPEARPLRRRRSARGRSPATIARPADGTSMPPRIASSVDLPLPEAPTMATISPGVDEQVEALERDDLEVGELEDAHEAVAGDDGAVAVPGPRGRPGAWRPASGSWRRSLDPAGRQVLDRPGRAPRPIGAGWASFEPPSERGGRGDPALEHGAEPEPEADDDDHGDEDREQRARARGRPGPRSARRRASPRPIAGRRSANRPTPRSPPARNAAMVIGPCSASRSAADCAAREAERAEMGGLLGAGEARERERGRDAQRRVRGRHERRDEDERAHRVGHRRTRGGQPLPRPGSARSSDGSPSTPRARGAPRRPTAAPGPAAWVGARRASGARREELLRGRRRRRRGWPAGPGTRRRPRPRGTGARSPGCAG